MRPGWSAAPADDLLGGVQRRLDEIKSLNDEIKSLRGQLALGRASELAAIAHDGVVVTQVDGLAPGDLRDLAIAVRQQPGMRLVVHHRRDHDRRRRARRRGRPRHRPRPHRR